MQHARHARSMNREVNKKRRRVHLTSSLENLPRPIDHDEITRRHLAPRQPVRRHQERILPPRRDARQVITHPLVVSVRVTQLIRRREIDSRAPHVRVVPIDRARDVHVRPRIATASVAATDARIRLGGHRGVGNGGPRPVRRRVHRRVASRVPRRRLTHRFPCASRATTSLAPTRARADMFARAIDGGDDAVRARDARETRDRETRARDADRVAPPNVIFFRDE